MIITITGRIGSGKDTVLSLLNIPTSYKILDGDKIGHEVLEMPEIISKIHHLFPQAILEGKVNRSLLAKMVFPHRIHQLNAIVHPEIRKIIGQRATGNVIINAALLDELKLRKLSNKIIFVDTLKASLYRRLNSKMYKRDIKKRLQAQHTRGWFQKRADIIIHNNGSLSDLKLEILSKCQNLF